MSLVKAEGSSNIEVNEDVHKCQILGQEVQHQKDNPFQTIPICPHRDGIPEDFHFSAICPMIMGGCGGECVFPTFSKAALNTNSETNCCTALKAVESFQTVVDEML